MFWVFAIPEIGVLVLILSDIKGVFFNDKIWLANKNVL
jgi:hypothetical protein